MNVILRSVFAFDEGELSQIYKRGDIMNSNGYGTMTYLEGEAPAKERGYSLDGNFRLISSDCITSSMSSESEDELYMVIDLPKSLAPGDTVTLVHLYGTREPQVVAWEKLAASKCIESTGEEDPLSVHPLSTCSTEFVAQLFEALFMQSETGEWQVITSFCL